MNFSLFYRNTFTKTVLRKQHSHYCCPLISHCSYVICRAQMHLTSTNDVCRLRTSPMLTAFRTIANNLVLNTDYEHKKRFYLFSDILRKYLASSKLRISRSDRGSSSPRRKRFLEDYLWLPFVDELKNNVTSIFPLLCRSCIFLFILFLPLLCPSI